VCTVLYIQYKYIVLYISYEWAVSKSFFDLDSLVGGYFFAQP